MPAIVTKEQRVFNAKTFIESFSDGSPLENHLYLWIGKSDLWNNDKDSTIEGTPEVPILGSSELAEVTNEMIAMKKVSEENLVNSIPTYEWVSGRVFTAWDDNTITEAVEDGCTITNTIYDKMFYCINNSMQVFKCLEAGTGASTVQPNHTSVEPRRYSDGYVWHFMFILGPTDMIKFYNNYFLPVRDKETQHQYQSDIDGGIFSIVVTDGGSGYTTAPTVTINGTGTGANATAMISGGEVSRIFINVNGDSTLQHGVGYTSANVVISGGGGSGATARAIISPVGGHGYDPVCELAAHNVQIAVTLDGDEGGDFVVGNEYRRVGLIKNPELNTSPTEVATTITMNCLDSMNVGSIPGGSFSVGDIIEGVTSGAFAFIDSVVTEGDSTVTIYYHQNKKTGWVPFEVTETITDGVVSGTINSLSDPDYRPFSGNIIFIENREPIQRTSTSREDVRLVLQF